MKEAREASEKIKRDEEAVKAGEKAVTDKWDATILEESKKAAAKLLAALNRDLDVLAKNKEEEAAKEALEKDALRLEMKRTKLVVEMQAMELQEVAAKEAEAKAAAHRSGADCGFGRTVDSPQGRFTSPHTCKQRCVPCHCSATPRRRPLPPSPLCTDPRCLPHPWPRPQTCRRFGSGGVVVVLFVPITWV